MNIFGNNPLKQHDSIVFYPGIIIKDTDKNSIHIAPITSLDTEALGGGQIGSRKKTSL